MALSNHDQVIIRDYLLGKLDEHDQQKIEERLMVEDELFEEFEVSKSELVEEYVAGELPQKDHEWFKTHFLASPEGRQTHAFTMAMDRLQGPAPAPVPVVQRQSWWERVRSLLSSRTWTVGLATSAATVLILAFVITRSGSETLVGPTLIGTVITRGEGPLPEKVKVGPKVSKLRIRLL